MTLQQIKYFILAAETLNFTTAAQKAFTTQPTVSKQVSLLEAELGYPLFHNKKKHMALTPAGEYLALELKKALDIITSAEQTAGKMPQHSYSKLSVGSIAETWLEKFFMSPLLEFKEVCPSLEVVYEKYTHNKLIQALEDNALDLVFTLNIEKTDWNKYSCHDLGAISSGIVMSGNHPLLELAQKDLSVLKNETFLLLDNINQYQIDKIFPGCKSFQYRIMDNYETILSNVALGNGIAIANHLMYQNYIPDLLHTVTIHMDEIGPHILAVHRKDSKNPAVPLFLNLLFNPL